MNPNTDKNPPENRLPKEQTVPAGRGSDAQDSNAQPAGDLSPASPSEPPAIPYARPELGREEEKAVLEVMRSGWLTTGGQAGAFEREFAAVVGPAGWRTPVSGSRPDTASGDGEPGEFTALALSSASAGLHIGLKALGLKPGTAVALSPYTFAASMNSIISNGLTPLLVDTAPGGYHLDPAALEAALSRRGTRRKLSAVMAVHFGGWEEGGPELEQIADRFHLELIEDAAHSFPARRADRPGYAQGSRGRFGVFSFYANKTITTGEGGMLITRDRELARSVSRYRLHGISKDVWNRYTDRGAGYRYDIEVPGYKYNMPDILAAIGRVQLVRAADLMDARRRVALAYSSAFADRDWIIPPPGVDSATGTSGGISSGGAGYAAPSGSPGLSGYAGTPGPSPPGGSDIHSWHIYSLRLNPGLLGISRDDFIGALNDRGIGTSVHFIPLHTMSYYRRLLGSRPEDFPNAMESFENSISLPIFPGLRDDEVARIIDEVLKIGDTHYRGR